MGRAYKIYGENRNAYKILVGSPEGNRSVGKYIWADNIKINRKEMGLEGVDWIHLAPDVNE
jgi:hypothetical protein